MIGQNRLIDKIDSLKSFPHSVLLQGERGSEQQDICNYISNKFDLIMFDLTECISDDFISEIMSSHTKTLYVIDMSKISEREQNVILKVYEEPSYYVYFLLICENDSIVLDTIKNRSVIYNCDKYTEEQLKPLISSNEDLVLKICSTPGQVEIANHTDIVSLMTLCSKIISSIGIANYANTLSIANKINFSDEYSKFDLYLFIKAMKQTCLFNIYNDLYQYESSIILNRINTMNKRIWSLLSKQQQFENFLTKCWEDTH